MDNTDSFVGGLMIAAAVVAILSLGLIGGFRHMARKIVSQKVIYIDDAGYVCKPFKLENENER